MFLVSASPIWLPEFVGVLCTATEASRGARKGNVYLAQLIAFCRGFRSAGSHMQFSVLLWCIVLNLWHEHIYD